MSCPGIGNALECHRKQTGKERKKLAIVQKLCTRKPTIESMENNIWGRAESEREKSDTRIHTHAW